MLRKNTAYLALLLVVFSYLFAYPFTTVTNAQTNGTEGMINPSGDTSREREGMSSGQGGQFGTYESPELGLRIQIPQNSEIGEGDKAVGIDDDDGIWFMSIFINDASSKNIDQIMNEIVEYYQGRQSKILSTEETTVAGQPARTIMVHSFDDLLETTVVIIEDEVYEFLTGAPSATFEDYAPLFDKMISSFEPI